MIRNGRRLQIGRKLKMKINKLFTYFFFVLCGLVVSTCDATYEDSSCINFTADEINAMRNQYLAQTKGKHVNCAAEITMSRLPERLDSLMEELQAMRLASQKEVSDRKLSQKNYITYLEDKTDYYGNGLYQSKSENSGHMNHQYDLKSGKRPRNSLQDSCKAHSDGSVNTLKCDNLFAFTGNTKNITDLPVNNSSGMNQATFTFTGLSGDTSENSGYMYQCDDKVSNGGRGTSIVNLPNQRSSKKRRL
jgi:hypothetical protein